MALRMTKRVLSIGNILLLVLASCDPNEDSQGDAPERELLEEECRNAQSKEACDGSPGFRDGPMYSSCVWVDWVQAEVDPQTGECSFSEAEPRCEVTYGGSEGCPGTRILSSLGCEEPADRRPLVRPSDDGSLVGFAEHCFPTDAVRQCSVDDGVASPPECACLCAPDFPGD